MELDIEIGRIVFVAMVVASLDALSARSLSGMKNSQRSIEQTNGGRDGVYGTVD